MFRKMLNLTMVLFILMAFFLAPPSILSDSEEEIALHKMCGDPTESSVDLAKDADGNPTKGCSDYRGVECEGKTAEYVVTEAAGCTEDAESPGYPYYYYCITEKKEIKNGTVSCEVDEGLPEDDPKCTDGDDYSITGVFYKHKCESSQMSWTGE